MRCVVLCLLLCVSSVLGQLTITGGNGTPGTGGWSLSGYSGLNPAVNFTEGTTYTFTIGFVNSAHPFALSADGTNTAVSITGIDAGFTVSAAGCTGSGTQASGWQSATAGACVVSITPAVGTAGKPLFYRCAYHGVMVGQINVLAAASASASSSSTGGSTGTATGASTATGTGTATGSSSPSTASGSSSPAVVPQTGQTLTGTAFRITSIASNNSTFTGFVFTVGSSQYVNPTLNVTVGTNITFSLEYTGIHPFGFSPIGSTASVAATQQYFPDQLNTETQSLCDPTANPNVTTYNPTGTGNPCVLTVPVPTIAAGQTIYYRCSIHPQMVGQINILAATSGSGSGSSTSSTSTGGAGASSSPSGTSSSTGSTPAPTNPPASSSSGKNSASQMAGAGLAAIVAVMATIMA